MERKASARTISDQFRYPKWGSLTKGQRSDLYIIDFNIINTSGTARAQGSAMYVS
jgi:hypothetical protein